MPVPEWLEIAKTATEVAAFSGATMFFGYKAVTGYLIVNVSLSARANRVRADADWDHLAVAATIEKGSSGSLELHEAKARVSWTGTAEEHSLVGIERLSYVTDPNPPHRKRLTFGGVSRSRPVLRLAPGEHATFSAALKVPQSEVCMIEVAVTGRLTSGWKQGQWRTSIVALPIRSSNPTAGR